MPEIRSPDDWDRKKHEVDLFAFRVLIEPSEENFLRESLSPIQFRLFQRARCRRRYKCFSFKWDEYSEDPALRLVEVFCNSSIFGPVSAVADGS
jgi:hypothetical protein